MSTTGSVDQLVWRLVEHEFRYMTVDQLRRVKAAIDNAIQTGEDDAE